MTSEEKGPALRPAPSSKSRQKRKTHGQQSLATNRHRASQPVETAMTSELRPAVEVWDDAIAAWAADTIDTRQAAAAVIEAYGDEREAKGREEQAAELAKYKALAETLAGALGEAVTWNSHDDEGVAAVWLDQADEALRQYNEVKNAG